MDKKGQLQFENELIRVWKRSSSVEGSTFDENHVIFGLQEGKMIQKNSLSYAAEVIIIEMKSPKSTPFPSIPID